MELLSGHFPVEIDGDQRRFRLIRRSADLRKRLQTSKGSGGEQEGRLPLPMFFTVTPITAVASGSPVTSLPSCTSDVHGNNTERGLSRLPFMTLAPPPAGRRRCRLTDVEVVSDEDSGRRNEATVAARRLLLF